MSYVAWCRRGVTDQNWRVQPIGDITVSQSKNEPACMRGSFMRDEMTIEPGDEIAIQNGEDGDNNLFYGWVESTSKSDDKVDVTAYDQLYFMKISPITKVFGDIKASDLFIQLCEEKRLFMLDPPVVSDTGYPIPGVVADNVNPLDLINEALNVTFDNTQKRYYVWDAFKDLRLAMLEELRIDPTEFQVIYSNSETENYTEDLSEMVNEVIVYADGEDGSLEQVAVARDDELILRYKARTYYHKIQEGENAEVIAQSILEEKRHIKYNLSVTVFGDNVQVYPGRIVSVDYYHSDSGVIAEYIMGDFVIDSVTHTLSAGTGKMDLQLSIYKMGEF